MIWPLFSHHNRFASPQIFTFISVTLEPNADWTRHIEWNAPTAEKVPTHTHTHTDAHSGTIVMEWHPISCTICLIRYGRASIGSPADSTTQSRQSKYKTYWYSHYLYAIEASKWKRRLFRRFKRVYCIHLCLVLYFQVEFERCALRARINSVVVYKYCFMCVNLHHAFLFFFIIIILVMSYHTHRSHESICFSLKLLSPRTVLYIQW